MQSNPVTIDDLESRWRPLTSDEQPVAQALLSDAWALLNLLAPGVSDALPDSPLESVSISSVCAAVKRVMLNPDGNKSESLDDYSFTRDASSSTGALGFTEAELEAVRGITSRAVSGRFSNQTTYFA